MPPLIVISGPIGSGKGTIVHALVCELDLTWVPTHTTRAARRDDFVLSRRIFDSAATFSRRLARDEFIETTKIAGHYFGLAKADIESAGCHGRAAIVELTVAGGAKVARLFPRSLLLFIQSPRASRIKRIQNRDMNQREIASRLRQSAAEERLAQKKYDYLIENRDNHPEAAIDAVKKIIVERFSELAK